jgi:hypothetical protein
MKHALIPPIGTKVKIETKDIFGDSVYTYGKISSAPYQHGFDYAGGSWGLYDLAERGHKEYKCSPCFKFEFKPVKKKNAIILKVSEIASFEPI